MASWVELAAEVDDVLETTEAFWAARSKDNSRVKRLTCQTWSAYRRAGLQNRKDLPLPPAPSQAHDGAQP